jgi:hypothetical protein
VTSRQHADRERAATGRQDESPPIRRFAVLSLATTAIDCDINCCIIVWEHFCWKCVQVKSYTYTCTVGKLVCRYELPALQSMTTDWLIFAMIYLLWRQRKGKGQKYHIQMLIQWFLFSGVSYCDNGERVFMFDYDTKEGWGNKITCTEKNESVTPYFFLVILTKYTF